jgi:carboxymethylenebutenolidase
VDTVEEFQARLKTLSGVHEIYIYENAGHGFANEGASRYNKEAADLAWKRTVTFLEKYL